MKTSFRRVSSAFTLIELLVVIAIIALLAAILFPVFSRARENARRSSCLSNMKQIGLGVMQYTQDYDEAYPLTNYNLIPPSTDRVTWRQLVQPYIKSTQVFTCPSNTSTSTDGAPASAPLQFPAVRRHYSTNTRMNSNGGTLPWGGPLLLSGINEPARKVWAAEVRDGDRQTMFENWGSSAALIQTVGDNMFAGHLGTAVYLFADGHAKAMRPTQTGTPFNMWGRMTDSPSSCNVNIYSKINCDTVSNNQLAGLTELESRFD